MKLLATLLSIPLLASARSGFSETSARPGPTLSYPPGITPPSGARGLQEPSSPDAPPAPRITVTSPVPRGQDLIVTVHAWLGAVCVIGYGVANPATGRFQPQQTALANADGVATFRVRRTPFQWPATGPVFVQCDGSHLATA